MAMDCNISFPLGVFPEDIRTIVESLHKYENYNVDFTAAAFFTVFAAAMGNTWSARFMTGWVSRPIIYMVLIGPPSCGKTPPLRQAISPLLKLDEEYDRRYDSEAKAFRKWERLTAKQRKQQSMPEEMEMPKRRCHVVVNSTIEALISSMRDNPNGVLIYNDEIDSLLSNFNRYNGSDESYFLSLFSGTPFKYTRKSNNEYIFLARPYCSIIGSTQPGMLSSLFGGKRALNGFSSRFLKVYPPISAMPTWNDTSMPDGILQEWECIIRKVAGIKPPPPAQEGKTNGHEFFFSSAAKQRLISWKNEVNSRIYSESESETEKALCGKLETYLIRFCLVIQVMRGICEEADMIEIDEESALRAICLTEYFRAMESRIVPEMEVGVLDLRHTELLSLLPQSFTTAEAVSIGKRLGLSESTVKRFLREGAREFIRKEAHGHYCKS